MKTKQNKEESDKSLDEDAVSEPKTRAGKKAFETNDEAKPSKETRKATVKPKTIIKKKPIVIRKTLRNKKITVTKDKIKKIIKPGAKRGRKPTTKTGDIRKHDVIPIIPASEIKNESTEELSPNSRSSSPKTTGRRQRLSIDVVMMKSVLSDPPTNIMTGPRTSSHSKRSECANSPSLIPEVKNLRSGKPRKVKSNLLNEVVKKQQNKRTRLLSDSKLNESVDGNDPKVKRGRSCSREGSEISKSSDITESDISLSEAPSNDTDIKELNKKIDKNKTDLGLAGECSVKISPINIPCVFICKLPPGVGLGTTTLLNDKKKLSLKRSTSLDSDNNNGSSRIKLETLHRSLDSDEKPATHVKADNDTLFNARSKILTSMSKTFNSKEMSKNIRKARRGRKVAAATKSSTSQLKSAVSTSSSISNENIEDKSETLESLSKEIDDLITNLDQTMDNETVVEIPVEVNATQNIPVVDTTPVKALPKNYATQKPLCDNNSIVSSTEIGKGKEAAPAENTTPTNKESDNLRLHYEDDATEKPIETTPKPDITFNKCNVASIDKLMGRLKEFEEFDKRRQRQETESKSIDPKQVMVSNDVVLIPKSGSDIKPLKDIQSVRSPEKPLQKENFLSCFENNSAISIVKRDHVRRSVDLTDLPNSVTLIKRNSISRKESTGSNNSKESNDTISIFEKSLGRDVTLTEIRKSVDKTSPPHQVEIHQYASLHSNNPSPNFLGIDTKQISITPRGIDLKSQIEKRRPSASRKSIELADAEFEKVVIEKLKTQSPIVVIRRPSIVSPELIALKSPERELIAFKSPERELIAFKSPERPPMATEPIAPTLEDIKEIPEDIPLTANTNKSEDTKFIKKKPSGFSKIPATPVIEKASIEETTSPIEKGNIIETASAALIEDIKATDINDSITKKEQKEIQAEPIKSPSSVKSPDSETSPNKAKVMLVDSFINEPGPSKVPAESPGEQQRKENVLRTLGLLTHKAAKEAKIEKAKEKERIYKGLMLKNKAKASTSEYTGTLKTVIKLNRGASGEREKKRYRSSLKMTFQKSKNRHGKPQVEPGEAASDDEAYYTIERREVGSPVTADGTQRKSYSNRLNNHDPDTASEAVAEPVKEATTAALVIPEKASSFSIHPGRLCMDQCFYCGGKFGLFDTPCHIAQMKSVDRQKKVLENWLYCTEKTFKDEEKLTIDSCLCDACYRHVDRRANCPSYRKRPFPKQAYLQPPGEHLTHQQQGDKVLSPPLEDESDEESSQPMAVVGGRLAICHTEGCTSPAESSIRRKWLIKMRSSVNKVLKLEGDYPGLHTIPLCNDHYRLLAPLMSCVMCQRKIIKHHDVHFIHHGFLDLNPLLKDEGIPVSFTERPVVCKMCRYYCTLLQRPGHNDKHAKNYRRRLLQVYNIEVPPDSSPETEESLLEEDSSNVTKHKSKKARTKSKQRKSTELEKHDGESPEKTDQQTEAPMEMPQEVPRVVHQDQETNQPMEEDIESLISSNRILVPGASKPQTETDIHHDITEPEMILEIDPSILHLDKQTELQYLLQKQNNPAQFLQTPSANLTQKQRNVMKLQNVSLISKPGHQHRIHEKNAKRIHKLGQIITQQKDKERNFEGNLVPMEASDADKVKDTCRNMQTDEASDQTGKKPADIATLKNKWQMSESFTQVKKNLSELSKNLTVDKSIKKLSDLKYSNPVKRLETNPSISVRELFPGEEEMNLQCNIEYNNVKGTTPEGWEKCNMTLQYDVETKRLWNELQQPYGNQSSFLRHLVILEKFFRSGDLVLSQTANTNAANYSDSVQSRLRAFDNVATDAPRRSEPAISLIEFRKQKPIVNGGKSLLKTNQNVHHDKLEGKKIAMPPPSALPKAKIKIDKKSKQLPPELIAINSPVSQGRKAIQNVLHNIQQLVKGVSASDPTEVAAAPLPALQIQSSSATLPPPPKYEAPKEKEITLPDSPKKSKTCSKPWRPRLMTITEEDLERIECEIPQVAVDGRRLPSLVKVMSGGKRFHITLQDYNKMCIMRREKLQQLQEFEFKTNKKITETETLVTEIQPSTLLGNGGTLKQSFTTEKMPESDKSKNSSITDLSKIGNAATILKNVGLKNITIAPIPAKTATVTSHTFPALTDSSPPLLMKSTPVRLPQLGTSVSITSDTILTPASISLVTSQPAIIMPKIPKSLTVIPQTVIQHQMQPPLMAHAVVVPSALNASVGPAPAPDPRP